MAPGGRGCDLRATGTRPDRRAFADRRGAVAEQPAHRPARQAAGIQGPSKRAGNLADRQRKTMGAGLAARH